MDKNEKFFRMVKDWTVSDYRTQKIKSEVIIDMMISEFMSEIVSYGLNTKYGLKTKIQMVAKEFPIERIAQKDNEHHYASVDYLLMDIPRTVYLTELKTTNDSVDGLQLLNMLNVCRHGIADLRKPFHYAVLDYGIKSHFNDRQTKKYLYSLKNMMDSLGIEKRDLSSFSDGRREKNVNGEYIQEVLAQEIINAVFGKIESATPKAEIKILYVSLHHITVDDILKKANLPYDAYNPHILLKPIILAEYISNDDFYKTLSSGKQAQWDCVEEILKELLLPYSNWF